MQNHNLHLDTIIAVETPQLSVPSPKPERLDYRLSPGQFLAPLSHAIASLHRRTHQGGNQVIVRFQNGYGAIIADYHLLEGIYEIAPLRFHGPGPDDYEFYFRSHVSDLTWCSEREEMVKVCAQISQLLPSGTV